MIWKLSSTKGREAKFPSFPRNQNQYIKDKHLWIQKSLSEYEEIWELPFTTEQLKWANADTYL